MFIRRAPAAVFACSCMKSYANRSIMALIYTTEFNPSQDYAVCLFHRYFLLHLKVTRLLPDLVIRLANQKF